MKYDLDLTKNHAQRQFGDLTVFFTWYGRRDTKPALAILPTKMIGREGAVPCVVLVTTAYKWAEETGDGAHCARASAQFAELLGLNPMNVNDVMRVTSIIRECMHDLLTIPPRPTTDHAVVADAIRTDANGRQTHLEITDVAS